MDHETIGSMASDHEDGELPDSDDGYTPLQRPPDIQPQVQVEVSTRMEEGNDHFGSPDEHSLSSDSDFEHHHRDKLKNIPKLQPTPSSSAAVCATAQKKYNIWSSTLQEDSLTEYLKGCEVNTNCSSSYDRDIESYDYNLKHRMNGANVLKRRQSHSDDSDSSPDRQISKKAKNINDASRWRRSSRQRNPNKRFHRDKGDDTSSGDEDIRSPRMILDLNSYNDGDHDEIARDIANKLAEDKDELLLKVVRVLGIKLPIEVFKETQRIESNGGMLIMNGKRRRTPGGVFLFLLKNHETMTPEQRREIFYEDLRQSNKEQKMAKARKREKRMAQLKKTLQESDGYSEANQRLSLTNRDQSVEELKKTLQLDNSQLPVLKARKDVLVPDSHQNLSNPPPSPVTDCNRENSSDFDSHQISHVNITSPEKVETTRNCLTSYEDVLDMNCEEMDLF